MDVIVYNPETCIVCSEFMGSFKNDLTVVTGYSEKQIYQILESFTNTSFPPEVIDDAGICQNCFIRFNEYDEHQTLAEQIKSDLVSLFESSGEYSDKKVHQQPLFQDDEIIYETIEEEEEKFQTEEIYFPKKVEELNISVDERLLIGGFDWVENKNQIVSTKQEVSNEIEIKPHRSRAGRPSEVSNALKSSLRLFECDICSRFFKEKSKLKAHREIHTTERNVVCPVCGKTFKTQACLRSHKRVHNPVYMFCDYCGKYYTQKPELAKHIKFVHFNIREFFCQTCGAGFGSKGHLSTHMLTHKDQTSKTVICQICSSAFHTKAKLDRHMKTHTKERNFECGICNKKFLYSYNVTAHIRHVHYREKRKETDKSCSICNQKFLKLWKLREHMADVHQIVEAVVSEGMMVYAD